GRVDHRDPNIQNDELDVLVLGERYQRFDVRHFSVRVIEHVLFYRDVVEARKHSFITFGEDSTQSVAPSIAEAEVQGDLCFHAVNAACDDFGDPLVIVVVGGEQR